MTLNILMVLDNSFRPDLRVMREAATLSEEGNCVTILAWDRDIGIERPVRETIEGVEIVRIPVKSERQLGVRQIPKFLKFFWEAFRYALRHPPDVVHCHDLLTLPIGVFTKLIKKTYLVYDAHEIYWIMEAGKYPPAISWFIKTFENILLKAVDSFITVGEIRSNYYKQYTKAPIYIVGNWYDRQTPNLEHRRILRDQLGIPVDAFIVAYVGSLNRNRSIEVIIHCAELAKENNHIHWIICGDGPERQKIEEASTSLLNFHYLGWVDEVSTIYSASDTFLYLMDSDHPYARYIAPNNLYLSIAWLKPLIGVKTGEIKQVLSTDAGGFLFSEYDTKTVYKAIQRLYEDTDTYAQYVELLKGLQHEYSWEKAQQNLLDAYRTPIMSSEGNHS